MVVAEPLVVGAVPGLVCVQQGDHQPRPLIVPPHPAGGLDVLGMGLRLALNHHQPQPRNVQAHGDHVGGDGAIDPLLLVEGAFQPLPRFGHLVGGDAGGQLQHLGKGAAVLEQAPRFADALALAVLLEGVLHLLLQNAPGAAEFAQAVEVAEHGHVRVGGVVLVLVPAGFPKGPLRRAHQRQPDLAHDQFGAASRGGDAEIAAPRGFLQRQGEGKEGIPPVRPRRWEDLGLRPAEQGLNLILGAAHGGGGGDDLGPRRRPVKAAHAQRFDGGFIQPHHGAERAGNQMQLVLDDEVRRRQRTVEALFLACIRRAVEALRIAALGAAEQLAGARLPRQGGELIDRGDEEGRQAAVNRLIHRQNGQGPFAAEVALEVGAGHPQLLGRIAVGPQLKGIRREFLAAPRAVLQGDGGGPAVGIGLELPGFGPRRIRALFAPLAHAVGRGRLAHPKADLEGPFAVAFSVVFPLQFQGADQSGGPGQLVQGQQAQGVAHDDAHPGPLPCVLLGIAQPAQHHRQGGQPQIGFRLAAAGGEEQQIDRFPMRVRWVRDAGQVQQDEGELEGPPMGRPLRELFRQPLLQRPRHGAVGHPEGVQGVGVLGQHFDAALHPLCGQGGQAQQFLGGFAPRIGERRNLVAPGFNPSAVLRHQGPQGVLRGWPVGQPPQHIHAKLRAGHRHGFRLLHFGVGNPGGAQSPANAIDQFPIRRNAVAGGVFRGVGVVQIRHPLVPIPLPRPAQIGPGHEGLLAADFDFGLEGEGKVWVVRLRCAPVHQKNGDRPRPGGDSGQPFGVDGPFVHMQAKAAGIRDGEISSLDGGLSRWRLHGAGGIRLGRIFAWGDGNLHGPLARAPLPDFQRLAVAILNLPRLIIPPAHGDAQHLRFLGNQKAQPNGRREKAPLGGFALLRRFLRQAARCRRFVKVLIFVGIHPLLFGPGAGRDEKAGQIPVRGPHPSGQALLRQFVLHPRADEVQAQGFS